MEQCSFAKGEKRVSSKEGVVRVGVLVLEDSTFRHTYKRSGFGAGGGGGGGGGSFFRVQIWGIHSAIGEILFKSQ